MTKVFIRELYPYTSGLWVPPSGIRLMHSHKQWARFESLLKTCLIELGHEIIEQREPPSVADEVRGATCRIYAHKTRRDLAGDLYYKQMHLSDLFTIDPLGWGADHSKVLGPPDLQGVEPAPAEEFVGSLRLEFLQTGASKIAQPNRAESNSLPDDYIFVPIQTPRDYVQVHHAPISCLSFVRLIADWANEWQQNVVFKLHPGLYPTSDCDNEIIKAVHEYDQRSHHVFCRQANVHDLIANAKGVFTINSGVGFESLIHGKPVVTFGACDYQWVTFRATADSVNAAREFVFGYTDELRQNAWRFIYHYFFRHAFSIQAKYIADSRRRLIEYLVSELGN